MRKILFGLSVAMLLSACGDPLRDVPRLADVPLDEKAVQADALADPATAAAPIADAPAPVIAEADKPRGGLLGFLRRRADEAKATPAPPDPATSDAPVVEAAATVLATDPATAVPQTADVAAPAAAPAPKPEKQRRGLFARRDAPAGGGGARSREPGPDAPDYRKVALGTSLPYGQIARVCGVNDRDLGTKSGQYPDTGRGFTLYDSVPGSTTPRTFYLTGFGDGCARQFTAALVLFGAPSGYETLRYSAAGDSLPKSDTDAAYETLKSRVCRVKAGQPCGDRMSRLEKNTVFVSVYERFGSNPVWKNILLHDGQVLATDVKG